VSGGSPGGWWLGLDVGTSSLKALLVPADGTIARRAAVSYRSVRGPRGEAEQDPRDYLEAAREAIAACGADGVELGGVGLVGQTPTLVLVDDAGEPVRPALTWQDHRAEAEARTLEQELGPAENAFGTGLPWTPGYAPAKLLWLSEHEPDAVARTRFALQPKDYLGLRLTGSPLSDAWSSKGLCNVRTYEPATAVIERAGFAAEVAPPLAAAWQTRGGVTAGAAAAFGLAEGTPVAVGWSDALAAMLAVGAFDSAASFVLAGTSSIVGVTTSADSPAHPDLMAVPPTCTPLEVHYGPTESSGASVEWLARLLRCEPAEVLELAASAAPRPAPAFVPYLAGERAPVWRTESRAVVLGLGSADGPAELARAVVSGVCLSEADVLDVAERHLGTRSADVAVAGRGAADAPWREGRLVALGRALRVLEEPDASALGAAMLGAAAASAGDLAVARTLRGRMHAAVPAPGDAERAPALLADYRRAAAVSLAWADREEASV
jgi:xylulokinase